MNHGRARRITAALLALLSLVALTLGCTRTSETPMTNQDPDEQPVATSPSGAVSFPLAEDTGEAVKRAGLSMAATEQGQISYRAHLDVIVDGQAVEVPGRIGINRDPVEYSPLNTRDTSGIVHVRAVKDDEVFRVGQLFQEWGVNLDKNCLASFCIDDDHQLLGFANGQLVPDPAAIPFQPDQEVVIWYGPKGTNPAVPISYTFPPPTAP